MMLKNKSKEMSILLMAIVFVCSVACYAMVLDMENTLKRTEAEGKEEA